MRESSVILHKVVADEVDYITEIKEMGKWVVRFTGLMADYANSFHHYFTGFKTM